MDNNSQRTRKHSLVSALRSYGLVFNDDGTLRMDCGGERWSDNNSAAEFWRRCAELETSGLP